MATFKLGQRVRFVKARTPIGAAFVGQECIIIQVGQPSLNPITFERDYCDYGIEFGGKALTLAVNGDQLEPLTYDGNTLTKWADCPWSPSDVTSPERELTEV